MRILITSTDVMMYQFLIPHALALIEDNNEVDIICSKTELYKNEGYIESIRSVLGVKHVNTIDNTRSPFSLSNIKTVKIIKSIIDRKIYDLIWTNEPVMSVLTRLAAREARKKGTKVLYCAHGYHFFKGAPLKNWLFYPIEKIMAYYCDEIVLINWEDYYLTKKHMNYVRCAHIDGIGFEPLRFQDVTCDRDIKRKEIGISENEILLICVGELQKRKNHEPVIDALSLIGDARIKLFLCGYGELFEYLKDKVEKLGLNEQVSFLGHRYDIPELLKAADIFVHPSQREGLGISVLEAMASGLPVISSNVQGLKDLIEDGVNGIVVEPYDVNGYAKAIKKLSSFPSLRKQYGLNNQKKSQKFSLNNSIKEMKVIIQNLIGESRV
jgi:glycosyltransferase EpsD